MKTSERLELAKSKIANEANWLKGLAATGIKGSHVSASFEGAVSFCSSAALYSTVPGEDMLEKWKDAENSALLLRKHMEGHIIRFNDSHSHREVMEAWDAAIAEAKEIESAQSQSIT